VVSYNDFSDSYKRFRCFLCAVCSSPVTGDFFERPEGVRCRMLSPLLFSLHFLGGLHQLWKKGVISEALYFYCEFKRYKDILGWCFFSHASQHHNGTHDIFTTSKDN
jgi:hypothetical protein